MTNRNKPVEYLKKYLGIKEGSDKHKEILDVFNNSKKCTYKMTVNDSWCATSVSAAFIATGLSDIFPCVECSCQRMIDKAKNAGIWVENDAFVPNTGDVIMYDWQDNGIGDNTGWADHVGIVVSVIGDSIKVIEGNKSDTVSYRTLKVNGKGIRGYITPKFESEPVKQKKTEIAFKGTVTATLLNVRTGAGTEFPKHNSIKPLSKNTTVEISETVKDSTGANWYRIKIGHNYGYASAKFIKKV